MNHFTAVHIFGGQKDLSNKITSILLRKTAFVNNAIKEFTTCYPR